MNIDKIIKVIKDNENNQVIQNKVFDIYSGNILNYLLGKLKDCYSTRTYPEVIKRLIPVNILPKIIDKLSLLYSYNVNREDQNSINTEIMNEYEDNTLFLETNRLLNAQRRSAIEIYYNENSRKIESRVLPAHAFLVVSENTKNPTIPTIFIKYMGKMNNEDIYHCYDQYEFVELSSKGTITQQLPNPYGVIPFVYVNSSRYTVIPSPDVDGLEITINIPLVLAELNYAMGFQCNALMYSINAAIPANFAMVPNSILELRAEDPNMPASLNSITPTVNSDQALKLLFEELTLYLNNKGLKASSTGSYEMSASGIAKLIDNADNIQINKSQIPLFNSVEQEYWHKLAIIHNQESINNKLGNKLFTDDFNPSVTYEDIQPVISQQEKLSNLKLKLDAGLTSKKRAIREANPELDDTELEALLLEIEEEHVSKPAKEGEENNFNKGE